MQYIQFCLEEKNDMKYEYMIKLHINTWKSEVKIFSLFKIRNFLKRTIFDEFF